MAVIHICDRCGERFHTALHRLVIPHDVDQTTVSHFDLCGRCLFWVRHYILRRPEEGENA